MIFLWIVALIAILPVGAAIELGAIWIGIHGTWKRNIWMLPSALGMWLLCVWGGVECLIHITK